MTFQDLKGLTRRFEIEVISYISDQESQSVERLMAGLSAQIPAAQFHSPVRHSIHQADRLYLKSFLVAKSVIRGVPYTISKYRSAEYVGQVAQQLRTTNYDALYIDHAHPSYVLKDLPHALIADIPVVYRAHDVLFETVGAFADQLGGVAGVFGRVQSKTYLSYERELWQASSLILTVTRRLRDQIRALEPQLADRIVHWPVPVDVQLPIDGESPTGAEVLYLGTVRYPTNLTGLRWFIKNCWPKVLEAVPEATFHVAGKGSELLNVNDDSIHLHGYVDDPRPLYARANALVVPLFSGSGIRVKILDSVSHGVPVVTTTVGHAGLEITENQEVLVANDADRFAEHLIKLLRDPGYASGISNNGVQFLKDFHSRELADEVVDTFADQLAGPLV